MPIHGRMKNAPLIHRGKRSKTATPAIAIKNGIKLGLFNLVIRELIIETIINY